MVDAYTAPFPTDLGAFYGTDDSQGIRIGRGIGGDHRDCISAGTMPTVRVRLAVTRQSTMKLIGPLVFCC